MHIIKHFITITRHRHLVMKYCFKCGLYSQGLKHDLSKYSFTEFFNGAKYYLGTKSPHHAERLSKGYSDAWMHHKGRNKHHVEYWIDVDMSIGQYAPVKMPDRYLAESICDRIAASKNYNRKTFKREMVLNYFLNESPHLPIHPKTKEEMEELLRYYVLNGDKKTFKYIKRNLRSKKATY